LLSKNLIQILIKFINVVIKLVINSIQILRALLSEQHRHLLLDPLFSISNQEKHNYNFRILKSRYWFKSEAFKFLVTYLLSLSLVLDGDPGLTEEKPPPPPVLTFNAFFADGEPPSSVLNR